MIHRVVCLISVLGFALLAGCAGEPQLQTIEVRKLAYFDAPADWLPKGSTADGLLFEHVDYPGVELWVSGDSEEIGGAITVEALRGLLGREANLEYGGVTSRLSLVGNAVIRYETEGVEQDESDTVNWIVARPWAGSHILRMEVSLEFDPGQVSVDDVEELVEEIDPYVADAGFPSAEA